MVFPSHQPFPTHQPFHLQNESLQPFLKDLLIQVDGHQVLYQTYRIIPLWKVGGWYCQKVRWATESLAIPPPLMCITEWKDLFGKLFLTFSLNPVALLCLAFGLCNPDDDDAQSEV